MQIMVMTEMKTDIMLNLLDDSIVVNTIEKVYLGSLMIVFGLGILSLFRLSHFKAELLKVFDSRQGFTFFIPFITKIEC